jgi:hypothetical protein
MKNLTIGKTLIAALLAGVLAALLVATFHSVATEPLIEQAIMLEEQMSHAGAPSGDTHEEAPIVSRDMQRVGLFIGYLLYGLSWASLFGAIYFLAQKWLPGAGASQRGLALASLAYWGIAFLPFIKYPANPPGVGDPATIDYRQALYLGLLGLALLGGIVTILLHNQFRQRWDGLKSWLPSLVFLVVFSVVVYLAMPANPDPLTMPLEVIQNFRALSFSGLTVFWVAFGLVFAWMAHLLAKNTGQAVQKI